MKRESSTPASAAGKTVFATEAGSPAICMSRTY